MRLRERERGPRPLMVFIREAERHGMTDPIFFSPDDDAMRAAAAEARRTFRFFWREMTWEQRRIVPALDLAAVKVAFWDGDDDTPPRSEEVEHMWVGDVGFDGARLSGTLLNAPNHLRDVREGDPVDVPFERVGDWMYAIGGRVYGAFTVNLIRSRMSAPERREHDSAWGLDFGDPGSIVLIPDYRPKQGLSGLFGSQQAPIDLEAEHPMSENMTAKYAEQLAADPRPARVRDDAGWTQLHRFALGGSAGVVDLLLRAGADRAATTPDGRTALDLAEAIGWPRVVELLEAGEG